MTGTKNDEGKLLARCFYWEPLALMLGYPRGGSYPSQLCFEMDKLVEYLCDGNLINAKSILKCMHCDVQDWLQADGVSLHEVVKASELGANKYGLFNYKKGMNWTRLIDALGRHFLSYLDNDPVDKESELDHRVHMLANIYMLYYYVHYQIGTNDLREEI